MAWWPEQPPDAEDATGRGCDDPEVVRRAQHDTAAFTTFFDCYWALLLRYYCQ